MEFEDDILSSLKVLLSGGLILYPTDTIWGIGCDATNDKAVSRIYELKKRAESKSMIVLVTDEQELVKYVNKLDHRVSDFLRNARKPTTVIYEGVSHLAKHLIAEDGTVGIRIVDELFCKNLIKRFGKPIVSTSANLSGSPAPHFYGEISQTIVSGVDYVVRYRQKDKEAQEPSSIVKLDQYGRMTIVRT
jgi:L-threonylcarbamoyladenylate synthase